MSKTNETKRYSITLSRNNESSSFTQVRNYPSYSEAMQDYKKLVMDAADLGTLLEGDTVITVLYRSYVTEETRVMKSMKLTAVNNL